MRVYSYDGGWDEVLDIRTVNGSTVITATAADGSERYTRTHGTAIRVNMLAHHVPQGNAYQWASSPEGRAESAEAYAELLRHYDLPSHMITLDRIVARLTA